AIARWGFAIAVVAIGARTLLWAYVRSRPSHVTVIQPIDLATLSPTTTATKIPPALAAKLPPARRFALTSDGRAISFDGNSLKVHTRGGSMHEVADVSGPLAPRADSPLAS